MKYPPFLKEKDTIGLLATSCGNNVNPYRVRALKGIIKFQDLGYNIKKGHRLFRNYHCVSAPATTRANDFMSFYRNKNVNFLWSTGGGEIMMSMLPYIDFEKIKKLPAKFFMGFSDNTNLTFTLTTICDVATIYSTSIGHFAYETIDEECKDALLLMKGEKLSFDSYQYYQGENSKIENKTPLTPPLYKDEVKWISLDGNNHQFEGRIIGGCIDVLVSLCGTSFDNVKNFIEKYKEDGIIWYFDNCELNSCGLFRALYQFKHANYFSYVKGFIFGRHGNNVTPLNYSFIDAIKESIGDLNVPIIMDADISHISPSIPILNGAIAKVTYKDNKGNITYKLK